MFGTLEVAKSSEKDPIDVRCRFAGGSSSSIDLRLVVPGSSRDDTADGGRVEGRFS
jgi:hypothetical protein